MKKLMIALISLATAVTSLAPAQAMPIAVVKAPAEVSSDVQQVASRRYYRAGEAAAGAMVVAMIAAMPAGSATAMAGGMTVAITGAITAVTATASACRSEPSRPAPSSVVP